MAVNTAQIANLLRPGLAAVFGDYEMYPTQWKEFYETKNSIMQQEIEVEMRLLGLAELRAEGANTHYDDAMGQRWITTYLHRYTALGFIVTRQAIKDNLYKSQFDMQSGSLKRSFLQTDEVMGVAVLNNGFASSFANSTYTAGDGLALFSTAHPIDGATYANTPSVQANLNETSLQDAINTVQQFKDQAGLIVMVKPKKLIVPTAVQWQAERLLGSKFRIETANNDISAIVSTNAVPDGYRVNQFLTDTNGWFLMTDADNGFKHYARETLEIDMFTDFDNDNLKIKGVKRDSWGVSNPRAAYGSSGAT